MDLKRAALIAAIVVLIPSPSIAVSSATASTLIDSLPSYLTRSRPTWPKEPEFEEGDTLMGLRRAWTISFRGPGSQAFQSDSAFPGSVDLSEPCASWPYRHFLVGRDTLTTTVARVPEGCSESPGLVFRNRKGRLERVDVTPLYNWNIDAIWLTPQYLVLGATAESESALPQCVQIAFWELKTGRWYMSPTRGSLMHRPGFDLPALLPDWLSARVFETNGAVVLKGKHRGLAFWPFTRAWSLVDASTGKPVPVRELRSPRRVVEHPDQRIGPTLKREIKSTFARTFDKANRDLVDFNLIDLIRGPCSAHPMYYAVTARAVGRDRAPGRAEIDWSRELFAAFVLDSSLTRVIKSFPPFPSYRWLDTTAYFDLNAPDDSLVVWAEGTTYADYGGRFAYPCNP